MRRRGVLDAVHRQVEVDVIVGQPGHRGRDDGGAVIGLDPADDLLLVPPAQRVVVVPDHLDLGLVRFRPARLVEHPRHAARCYGLDLLGQFHRRLVALAGEQVIIGQLFHLDARRLGEFGVAETEPRAPQARQPLDEGPAAFVEHPDALAALDDMHAALAQRDGVGIGMQQRLGVADLGIRQRLVHDLLLHRGRGGLRGVAQHPMRGRAAWSTGLARAVFGLS